VRNGERGRKTRLALVCVAGLWSGPLFAGFGSTETYLPAVGSGSSATGGEFSTTIWATNLTSAPQSFTFQFLRTGQSNPSPASFSDSLAAGETRAYDDVIESRLGLSGVHGAARIVSSGEIFVSERISLRDAGDGGGTRNLFFTGVPKGFAVSAGQSASIHGVDQGGPANPRYDFALVETAGRGVAVNVQVFDGSGVLLGQKAYGLAPYEQIQPNVAEVVAAIPTENGRITATVTGGSGSVILAGARSAGAGDGPIGFEMMFRDGLVPVAAPSGGSGCKLCVTSLNGLTGALTLAAGNGITVTPNGSALTIANASPFSLPFSGTTSGDASALAVTNSGNGNGIEGIIEGSDAAYAVHGKATWGVGVVGESDNSAGVIGSAPFGTIGVIGSSNSGIGVEGTSVSDIGIRGLSEASYGVSGEAGTSDPNAGVYGHGPYVGVLGMSDGVNTNYASAGVWATGQGFADGVHADAESGNGIYGKTGSGDGVYGESQTGNGVHGVADGSSGAGVAGLNSQGGVGVRGDGNTGWGVFGTVTNGFAAVGGIGSNGSNGLYGESVSGSGLYATSSTGYAVYSGGNFAATGTKSFIEPHPTDPTKEIRYVSLEGPESGTYFRGTARVVNGFASIDVPETFRAVSSSKGLTVVTTPQGGLAVLACIRKDLNTIVIQGSSDVEFDYVVNGVRKAFENFQPVGVNRDFIPRSRGDLRFTKGLPLENVRRLKTSGILNADGTINLETAHRMGWDRQESWKQAEEEQAKR